MNGHLSVLTVDGFFPHAYPREIRSLESDLSGLCSIREESGHVEKYFDFVGLGCCWMRGAIHFHTCPARILHPSNDSPVITATG
jgi:hypothetical protein